MPVIDGSKWLFTNDGRKAIDGMSHYKRQLDEISRVTNWRLHDLRRTARSLMSRAGVSVDHAERCLGHLQTGVKGTYDRYAYVDEKRAAFEKLAGLIELILNPPPENVVELRKASNG
jgi:integrase